MDPNLLNLKCVKLFRAAQIWYSRYFSCTSSGRLEDFHDAAFKVVARTSLLIELCTAQPPQLLMWGGPRNGESNLGRPENSQ